LDQVQDLGREYVSLRPGQLERPREADRGFRTIQVRG
jgi:hypothetical protein